MPTDDDGNDAYRGRSGSGNLQAPFAYLLHLPVHIPVHTCIRLTYLLLTCFTCLLTVSTCMAVSIYIRPVAAAAALLLLLLLLPAPTTTLPSYRAVVAAQTARCARSPATHIGTLIKPLPPTPGTQFTSTTYPRRAFFSIGPSAG